MNDVQINEKIAEVCGWKRAPETLGQCLWFCPLKPGIKLRGIRSSCPDYCNDLNAMHEAENTLFSKLDWMACEYENLLQKITTSWAWYATARQRAEAFLRTLNLWEE